MSCLTVELPNKKYDIHIGNKKIKVLPEILKKMSFRKIGLITDDNVNELYGSQMDKILDDFDVDKIVVQSGEQSKNIKTYSRILENLIAADFSRSDIIITLGGGVIGDLGGFVAATLFRGIRYIQVPTTLLAQLDSSIGGKVAINSHQGKNLIGAFHHPECVIIDPIFLKTLDEYAIKSGLGELIKHAVIQSEILVEKLNSIDSTEGLFEIIDEVIYESLKVKKMMVEEDELDVGRRMVLNFGHTIGHSLEKNYNFNDLSHGEAVAIGMAIITKLSEEKELTEKGTYKTLVELLKKFNLRYALEDNTINELYEAMTRDKKIFNDEINLVLLEKIGEVKLKKMQLDKFKGFLGVE